ncbi:hypothetical protein [Pseudonocardia pini]|uniref:hypothetical protein n=1 Tax=Pseudonocardia pini TaxID=2758030 RepID=UPI0015EFF309|nr:hypothetical protein [Pseudonocardia pini]
MSTIPMRLVGRGVAVLGLSGALAAGVLTTAPQVTAPSPVVVEAQVQTVGFCPFGHNSSGGCRGGGINDNQRLNDALADTGRMYLDAGECAGKAVGKSLWKNRKKPSLPGVALGTVSPAIKCGDSKGY